MIHLKKTYLYKLPLFIVIIFVCLSFSSHRQKKFIPPGTVKISDTFFADATEISNFSWREYECWTKVKYGTNSPEHISTLPDTNVWRHKDTYDEPYVQHYYRHPAYKNYPVVGISYEQALAFCKWRTERVKEFAYTSYKKEWEIEYRLPTREEWELLSNNGGTCFTNNGRDDKGRVQFNHCYMETGSEEAKKFMEDYGDVTAPVYSYWKNKFSLFNMIGNVAEMISEKGISKGGSWRNLFEDCRPGKSIPYEKPTAWLGFRCVCVVEPI